MPGYDITVSEKDIAAYYINCFRSTARREKLKEALASAELKAARVSCFDGRTITDRKVCNLRKEGEVSPRAEITPIEVAINYSHRKAWERFLKSGKEYGLVLEDDIRISPKFKERLINILSFLEGQGTNFSILHLWNGNWMKTKSKMSFVGRIGKVGSTSEIRVMKENVAYNAGGTGYVLSRKFAETLIRRQLPIRWPVDLYIGSLYRSGKHLSIATKTQKNKCIRTPFIYISCAGPYGTGKDTTQRYEVPTVNKVSCKR